MREPARGWQWVVFRALIILASVALLLRPAIGLAQTGDNANNSAWWARVNTVGETTQCAAGPAWVHALDVEEQSEGDLATDPLATVLVGPELGRQERAVQALREQGHRVSPGLVVKTWHIIGGTPDDLVLYATVTRRTGYLNPASSQVGDRQWVETTEAAYHLLQQNGDWRLADRRVFEQTTHPVDLAEFRAAAEAYSQLRAGFLKAYNSGDLAGLATVLTEQALDFYQHSVQSLLDQGKLQRLDEQGTEYIVDVHNGSAVAAFLGTLTLADSPPQPLTLLDRLSLQNGQWKIAAESQVGTWASADGTLHMYGCDDTARGSG
jgi:hypothetical protein